MNSSQDHKAVVAMLNYFEANPEQCIHYMRDVIFNLDNEYMFNSVSTTYHGMMSRAFETYMIQNDPDNIADMTCKDCDLIFKQLVHVGQIFAPYTYERIIESWLVTGYPYLLELQKKAGIHYEDEPMFDNYDLVTNEDDLVFQTYEGWTDEDFDELYERSHGE